MRPINDAAVRFFAVKFLLWIFVITVVFAFLSAALDWHRTHTKDLFTTVIATETTLLGSAIGFYFAKKTE